MTFPDTPTVFIVDDDGRMRAAMQRLLKTVARHLRFCRCRTPGYVRTVRLGHESLGVTLAKARAPSRIG